MNPLIQVVCVFAIGALPMSLGQLPRSYDQYSDHHNKRPSPNVPLHTPHQFYSNNPYETQQYSPSSDPTDPSIHQRAKLEKIKNLKDEQRNIFETILGIKNTINRLEFAMAEKKQELIEQQEKLRNNNEELNYAGRQSLMGFSASRPLLPRVTLAAPIPSSQHCVHLNGNESLELEPVLKITRNGVTKDEEIPVETVNQEMQEKVVETEMETQEAGTASQVEIIGEEDDSKNVNDDEKSTNQSQKSTDIASGVN